MLRRQSLAHVEEDPLGASNLDEGFQGLMQHLGGGSALRKLRQLESDDFLEAARENEEAYRRDVWNLKARIRREQFMLLNPRSKFVSYWDMVTTLGIFYCVFVTPYEIGLDLPTNVAPFDGLCVANQIVSCIFLCDIFVQFFLPTPDPKRADGTMVRRRATIAKNYIKGWFLLDVSTVFPFDLLTAYGVIGGPVKIIKLLRILRLLKMAKVLRASAIIQRWEARVAISSTSTSLFKCLIALIISFHFFAGGWAFIPALQGSQRGEAGEAFDYLRDACGPAREVGLFNNGGERGQRYVYPCLSSCEIGALAEHWTELSGTEDSDNLFTVEYVANLEPWTCRAVAAGTLTPDYKDNPAQVYISALLVALLQLVGGVSTILPMNVGEYLFYFVSILTGTLIFAAIQGIICGVVTTGNPDEIVWRQQNDSLNFMMADTKVPQRTREFVRAYFRSAKKLIKRKSYDALIDSTLSAEMKGDVRFLVSMSSLRGVWWLQQCEMFEGESGQAGRQFLEDLSIRLTREAFAPKEQIAAPETLYIITSGMASRGGGFLGKNSHWGDIIVSSPAFRDTTPAVAMCYCGVAKITRVDLLDVLTVHTELRPVIFQCGLKLAMRRAMLIISVYAKLHLQRKARKMHRDAVKAGTSDAADHPVDIETLELSPRAKEKLRPDKVLLEVQAGLGKADWHEVEPDEQGKMKLVRKGDVEKAEREELKKRKNLAFFSEFHRTPQDEQPMLLAVKFTELQATTGANLAHLDSKLDRLTKALYSVSDALGVVRAPTPLPEPLIGSPTVTATRMSPGAGSPSLQA